MNREITVYILIPVVCALIGWMTNCIAVRMIFRPRRPVRILGLTIIGLIPRRRSELAQTIARTVEKELISHRDIQEVLQTPEMHASVRDAVAGRIEGFLREKIAANPIVAVFLQGETEQQIKTVLTGMIEREIPAMLDNVMLKLEARLDFTAVIRSKIEAFDLERLESIIYTIAARELKAIELLGGALGLVVGILQVVIIVMTGWYG